MWHSEVLQDTERDNAGRYVRRQNWSSGCRAEAGGFSRGSHVTDRRHQTTFQRPWFSGICLLKYYNASVSIFCTLVLLQSMCTCAACKSPASCSGISRSSLLQDVA